MFSSTQIRVFVLFALGYFVSYIFRGVNLGFAPFITHDLGLSAADLGLLTSLYFLGFAGAQLPAGALLDHFGVRRVVAGLLLVAAAGAWVFAGAHSLGAMMLGRLLIGIGVSVCLGGAFKAMAQHFPVQRLPLLNGLVLAVGGMGGVMVGSPLTWALTLTTWRVVSLGLVVLTVATAVALWVGVSDVRDDHPHTSLASQFMGTWQILRSRLFWKNALLSSLSQGTFFTMQSLWVGPYLHDVAALTPSAAARLVSLLGFAMMAGAVGFGALARSLERRGLSVFAFCGVGMVLFIAVQLLIMVRAPLPDAVLWAGYGLFGGSGILTYAVLAECFPRHMTGRVNTTLTLVLFLLIFVFQIGVGAVLNCWPAHDGHYPPVAHLSAWGILVALQLGAAIWYFMPAGQADKAARGTA